MKTYLFLQTKENERSVSMQIAEKQYGIPNNQALRESTHILHRNGRSGKQEFFDNGFGKMKNTDFEPLHYADN